EAGNAAASGGEVVLRAGPAGMIDERHAERDRSLLGGHAEDERSGVGLGSAKGGPADAERRDDAFHAGSRLAFSVVMQRNAHARLSAQGPIISSIHWRDAVKFARTAKTGGARPARGGRAPSMMGA